MNANVGNPITQAARDLGYFYGIRQTEAPLPVVSGAGQYLIDRIADGWESACLKLIESHNLITPESPREWI